MIKGVILAAGKGSRLYPITKGVPKVLLPVYDKPMIFYSVDALVDVGIKDIAIVTSIDGYNPIRVTLEYSYPDVNFNFIVDRNPQGNAGSFGAAKRFFKGSDVVLMFADNVVLGNEMQILKEGIENLKRGQTSIFSYVVGDPRPFGVIECDSKGKVLSIEEKPMVPKSNTIAVGIYVFTSDVVNRLSGLKLSPRGEYEITDVLKEYMNEGKLSMVKLDKDVQWFDTGNVDVLLDASIIARDFKFKEEVK